MSGSGAMIMIEDSKRHEAHTYGQTPLVEANFLPALVSCRVWGPFTALLMTIVGIPVAFAYLLFTPFVYIATKATFNSLRLTLTHEALIYKSGYYFFCCCCWAENTKTVPLEKIQDVELSQNVIERIWGLHRLSIQTAGSQGLSGAELVLLGVVEAESFRKRVFDAKRALEGRHTHGHPLSLQTDAPIGSQQSIPLLAEVRDVMVRMERSMARVESVLIEIRDRRAV